MKLVPSALIALAVVCVPVAASAQWAEPGATSGGWGQPGSQHYLTPADHVEPETEEEEVWYGWQILIADAALPLAVVATGGIGSVSYLATPAIIHATHGRGWAALGSASLRIGLPLVGAMAGSAASDGGDYGGLVLGLGFGIAAAITIDAAFLGWEKVPTKRHQPPKAASIPMLQVTQHGAVGGWQGTF